MSGWQYQRADGKVIGILSEDEIKNCARRGGISLDTPVMHDEKTHGQWVAARRIKALRALLEENQKPPAESAPPEPRVKAGYVPPRSPRPSISRLAAVGRGIQEAAGSVGRKIAAVAAYLTAKKPLHVCPKCSAEFAKYVVPGQCPLCGEWAIVACAGCGLEGGAKRFVENGFKCPRCGGKVAV